MPMLAMTSFPTICGPTKTAHRDASEGKQQNKKKKEIYVTSEPPNLACRLLYMTPDE